MLTLTISIDKRGKHKQETSHSHIFLHNIFIILDCVFVVSQRTVDVLRKNIKHENRVLSKIEIGAGNIDVRIELGIEYSRTRSLRTFRNSSVMGRQLPTDCVIDSPELHFTETTTDD